MTTNLFVIANVKQLRTGGSFSILLPFFRKSWGVGVLNSAIFNSFQIGLSLARFWRAFEIPGGRGLNPPNYPPRYATAIFQVKTFQKIVSLLLNWNWLYKQNGILMLLVFTSQYSHSDPNVNNPGKLHAPNN